MKLLIIFSLTIGVALGGGSGDWTYDDTASNGPSQWYLNYPECGSTAQTPINIEKSTLSFAKRSLSIDYARSKIKSTTLFNEGYAFDIKFEFANNDKPSIKWGGTTYNLRDAHIHGGPKCGGGSEHTVNGHRYVAELHLVHCNRKYKSCSEAAPQPDGLAVLGIFFELAEESTYDPKYANKFIKYLKFIANPGQNFTIPENEYRTIQDLIENDFEEYFSYEGSLTTPPCYESVRWLINKEPIRIYESEVEELLKYFPKNNRPLQPVNCRKVTEYANTQINFKK